jgi:uncharacterized alkaline shock family protein YloU
MAASHPPSPWSGRHRGADLSVSEEAVATVIRQICDEFPDIEARRCSVEIADDATGIDPDAVAIRTRLRISVAVMAVSPGRIDALRQQIVAAVESELLAPVDDRTLASLVGFSVLAVDGVARLEPTLKSLFQARLPRSTAVDRSDGVAVTSTGAITDVIVDLGTASRHQSREVAESVQRVIGRLLEAHGREVGRISVNVLTIDHGPSSAG